MSVKNTGRFAEGERNRQKALNFIIANPGCKGPEITAYMGGDKATNSTRMTRMADDGDVSRVLSNYAYRNKEGLLFNVSTYAYTALRDKTKPAAKVRETMAENVNGTKRAQAIHAMREDDRPGVIRNIDPDRKPLSNQGGQGSLRRMVNIGSVLA